MRDRCGFHHAVNCATHLSDVERRILEAYASGLSREEIGELLGLSKRTVGHYLTIAKEKLGAHTLVQAALLSIRHAF